MSLICIVEWAMVNIINFVFFFNVSNTNTKNGVIGSLRW